MKSCEEKLRREEGAWKKRVGDRSEGGKMQVVLTCMLMIEPRARIWAKINKGSFSPTPSSFRFAEM